MSVGISWRRLRAFILERDLFICSYCLDTATEVDHLIPVCQYGSSHPDNLTAACATCNRSKGGLTPHQWAAREKMRLPPWFYERHA